ncbi:protein kinase [Actinomycetospora sp. OC33-EN08]|uniref:non-specific serine/threonine protein kinase n=1 Tax=Actinomycetospora aurantiaca TaxID=3129233 RepID=A0ABU8MUY5_9PSEU
MSPRPADTRRLVGRYRLDSELGRGAMGTVWSAYDEVLHRPVAVKEVRLSLVPVSERAIVRERTLREARATAMLSHPNVVTLYDVVEVNAEPYVVMELLPSRSLASYIGERGTLTPSETAEIGSAVASALMTAHRAGITHRDVKPGNVLIGTDGQIKLTDFGIARNAAESSMTQTGTVLGSPPYIAPEVAMGRAVGPPADLWGLGATLYACLEGRPPYDAGDPVSTVSAVVHGEVPRPSGHGPVQDVVRGLMVKDPTLRMPLPAVRRRLRPLMSDPEGPLLSAPPSPATTEFRLPSPPSRADAPGDRSGLIPVGRSGTLVDGEVAGDAPGPSPRTAPMAAPGRTPDDAAEPSADPAPPADGTPGSGAEPARGTPDTPGTPDASDTPGTPATAPASPDTASAGTDTADEPDAPEEASDDAAAAPEVGPDEAAALDEGDAPEEAPGGSAQAPAFGSGAGTAGATADPAADDEAAEPAADDEGDDDGSPAAGSAAAGAAAVAGAAVAGAAVAGAASRSATSDDDRSAAADPADPDDDPGGSDDSGDARGEGETTAEPTPADGDPGAEADGSTAPERDAGSDDDAEPAGSTTPDDAATPDGDDGARSDSAAEPDGDVEPAGSTSPDDAAPPDADAKADGGSAAGSGPVRTTTPPGGTPGGGTPRATPPGGSPRPTPSGGMPVPAPAASETTMVNPRVAPRRGPTTPGPWPTPAPPGRRPPFPAGGPRPGGGPQALAADPGPLPFAPSRPGGPSADQQRRRRIAVVALVVALALAGLVGGYALTRLLGGQAPFSISLAPEGPVVDGVRLVTHSDDNARYSGTGMGFTALVPSTWQQFRLQEPGGDIVVRYVSDDAERELRVDRLVRFYPAQNAADYARLLADPARVGADAVRVEPLTTVAPARPGASEAVQQTVYRARTGATDDRTTWTRLVPSGADLWVVRMTAPSLAAGGTPEQFAAVADSFLPPV